MNVYRQALFLPIILFSCLLCAGGAAYAAGRTAAAFLSIGADARNAALGGTGVTDTGVTAIFENPAGLTRLPGREVSFMHAAWLEDMQFQTVSYAQPGLGGTIGVAAASLSMPAIEKFDNTGMDLGSTYTAGDMAVIASYARTFGSLPAGINVKYISSKLDDVTGTTVALDAGVLLDPLLFPDRKDIIIGAAIQNIGTWMMFDRESSPLPATVTAGASYLPSRSFTVLLDLEKPLDADLAAKAGLEYRYQAGEQTSFTGRAGYRAGIEGFDEGSPGVTAGAGFSYRNVRADYAFVPYGELNDTHRVSITFGF